MKIREYAALVGHEVVGKLVRRSDLERPVWDDAAMAFKPCGCRIYLDEANNEYLVSKSGVCIIDADGGVI